MKCFEKSVYKEPSMQRNQSGFTMLELLISILIMSIGVLGMAGLQIVSMQQNRSALMQGEATLKVNDLLDRIRANPSTDYSGIALTDTPASTQDCIGNNCSETQMKNYDIAQWQCSINSTAADGTQHTVCAAFGITGAMPGGQCVNAGDSCAGGSVVLNGDVYTVTVQWSDQQRVDVAGSNRRVAVSMKSP